MKIVLKATSAFFLICLTQNLKAQLKDEVGHTVTAWSNWTTTSCHKGIAWRLRQNYYRGNNNGFTWEYEVKNLYGRQVAFSYEFSEMETSSGNSKMRKTLGPNQTYRNTALPNANKINYFVFSVCFSSDGRCKDECYSPCDNGTPNIPDCATSNSSSSNNQTSTYSNNTSTRTTSTYTPSQPTKQQQQADAINQASNALMDLAKALDKAKAEKKERQRKEAAALLAKQNEERQRKEAADLLAKQNEQMRKNEEVAFEKSALRLIQYIGLNNFDKFQNYFSNLGYNYRDHQDTYDENIDFYEQFNIKYMSDEIAVVFPKGKEKFMQLVLEQLVEIRDYITFYNEDSIRKSSAFSITKTKGHISSGHGSNTKYNYDYILKVAERYSSMPEIETNLTQPGNIVNDYPDVLKAAQVEAGKETDEGYRAAAQLLEPYAKNMRRDELNSLGVYFWKVKDYIPAVKYYQMAADKGDDFGNYNLARCYQNGWGVDTSYGKAFGYYKKVNPGFEKIGETYHQLGNLCLVGANNNAGNSDAVTASKYYTMGTNTGNAECMLHLGEFYDTGGKLQTNLTLAKDWYKKACDLNEQTACTKLKALE